MRRKKELEVKPDIPSGFWYRLWEDVDKTKLKRWKWEVGFNNAGDGHVGVLTTGNSTSEQEAKKEALDHIQRRCDAIATQLKRTATDWVKV